MSRKLIKLGHTCIEATNGEEAFEIFESEDFDVILMDLSMPKMNGFDATRKIRMTEKGSAIPIIAVTANALNSEREKCLEVGMNAFMTKPFNISELTEILNKSGLSL